MSHAIVSGQLASAVADAATFTASYPAREGPERGSHDAGSFLGGFNHKMVITGASLVYPDDFDISFGASSITITNKTGATWAAAENFKLQLDIPGAKVFSAPDERKGNVQVVARTRKAALVRVLLGAPDTLDADGICSSQSIAAGTASTATSGTLNGALASTNSVTGAVEVVLDVPRNVVASWTTTAVLTVVGKDEYGNVMVESSASGTSLTGKKAFKTITRVWSTVAITSATVGTGDVLGLPVFLGSIKNVVAEMVDGAKVGWGIFLPMEFNATELAAATAMNVVAPISGSLRRFVGSVTATLGDSTDDLGDIDLTVNAAAVTGSTLTSFVTSGAIGTGQVVNASSSANAAVTVGDVIIATPSSTWASAGAVAVTVEIVPSGMSTELPGTFVTGMTTAGGSTATTGDVRGTYDPASACNGSLQFELLLALPDPGNRGAAQYAVTS